MSKRNPSHTNKYFDSNNVKWAYTCSILLEKNRLNCVDRVHRLKMQMMFVCKKKKILLCVLDVCEICTRKKFTK